MKYRQETELDLLRVLAALGVIVMHLAPVREPSGSALAQALHHILPAAVTWCVPCFVMVSGRFLLDPERPLPLCKLFGKYLKRLLIAFVVWSPAYLLFDMATMGVRYDLRSFVSLSLTGYYHMWYFFLLAGLYLIAPVMRRIAEDRRTSAYFLALFFAMDFLVEYGRYLPGLGWSIGNALDYAHIHLVLGYSGYFLLGCFLYLHREEIPPRAARLLYLAGLACFLFTCLAGLWLRAPEGEGQGFFQLYRKPNVVIESAALYLFFLRRVSRRRFSPRIAAVLGGCTRLGLGVYMAHVMVYECFVRSGHFTRWLNGMPVWILYTPLIYLLSLALSSLLRRIPVLGRYIV